VYAKYGNGDGVARLLRIKVGSEAGGNVFRQGFLAEEHLDLRETARPWHDEHVVETVRPLIIRPLCSARRRGRPAEGVRSSPRDSTGKATPQCH